MDKIFHKQSRERYPRDRCHFSPFLLAKVGSAVILTGVTGQEMCHWYKCQSLDMIFGVLCDDTLPPYPEEESGHYSLSTPNAGQGVFLLCMGPAGILFL